MSHPAPDDLLIEALARVYAMAALDRLMLESEDDRETPVDESRVNTILPLAAG